MCSHKRDTMLERATSGVRVSPHRAALERARRATGGARGTAKPECEVRCLYRIYSDYYARTHARKHACMHACTYIQERDVDASEPVVVGGEVCVHDLQLQIGGVGRRLIENRANGEATDSRPRRSTRAVIHPLVQSFIHSCIH
eukprot:GHVU01185530.1.p1 GENE.GHVU01185530.1~~GHVU01185530.1.p1  ORF type:complete len:143 (+),score=8.86 GHVU01185530.1:166-594(+)